MESSNTFHLRKAFATLFILALLVFSSVVTADQWGKASLTVDHETTDLHHLYTRSEPDPWKKGHDRSVFILADREIDPRMLENLYRVEGLTYIEFKVNDEGADPYVILKHRDRSQASVSAPVPKVSWTLFGPETYQGKAGLKQPIEFYGVDYDFLIELSYTVPPPPEPPTPPIQH